MKAFPSRGLYGITQTTNQSVDALLEDVSAAIRGGSVVIQYRDKNPINALFIAQELVKICHQHNIPLIINDDIELALLAKADGVHLGKDDGDIINAKKRLGSGAFIGVSCYNSIERALIAQSQGASYVAFGRFFPSSPSRWQHLLIWKSYSMQKTNPPSNCCYRRNFAEKWRTITCGRCRFISRYRRDF